MHKALENLIANAIDILVSEIIFGSEFLLGLIVASSRNRLLQTYGKHTLYMRRKKRT